MPNPIEIPEILREPLSQFIDPYLDIDYVSIKAIQQATLTDNNLNLTIKLGYPLERASHSLVAALSAHLQQAVPSLTNINIQFHWQVGAHQVLAKTKPMPNVKNMVAIASGKGGVGKSTTTVNLALALAQEGARVGILDADIYGPSQAIMTGIPTGTKPKTQGNQYFIPLQAHGLQVMSMGFLVDENTPMVWRGPMASGALQQLLNQTLWDDLDYLFVDMPPGTGDIQLTLSQSLPVTASVIVTTPQDIALLDAVKGIEMFRKVDIPVLGIIENMSTHICSNCGQEEAIFGHGGGDKLASQYQTPLLGQLPLTLSIREQADKGLPTVAAEPDSTTAQHYRDIALKTAALLSLQSRNTAIPNITMVDE